MKLLLVAAVLLTAATCMADDESLPPSPFEAYATHSSAKIVRSKIIGIIESKESRATIVTLTVEDPEQTPRVMRGVRIDLKHLQPDPNCDLIYTAWAVICKRANAALYIEQDRLETVSKRLPKGSAQLRPMEFISAYSSSVGAWGFIMGGHTFSEHSTVELSELIARAALELAKT